MRKIPKKIISKIELCHRYHSKSTDTMFEILRWFEENGHSDDDGDFQTTLNEIQGTGLEKYDIEKLEQYLNYNK